MCHRCLVWPEATWQPDRPVLQFGSSCAGHSCQQLLSSISENQLVLARDHKLRLSSNCASFGAKQEWEKHLGVHFLSLSFWQPFLTDGKSDNLLLLCSALHTEWAFLLPPLVADAHHSAEEHGKGRLLMTCVSICSACSEHTLQLLLQATGRDTGN